MKKLTAMMLALTVLSVLFTACGEEPVDPVAPSISMEQGGTFVTEGDTVFTSETFQTKITVTAGDADLNSIEVQENGTAVDISRLQFDGDPAGSNPSPLAATNASGFTWVITITAPDAAGINTYTIRVGDTDGQFATTSVELDVQEAKPTLELVAEEGFAASGDVVLTGEAFSVKVTAAPGSADLSTIEVHENGTAIAVERLMIDSVQATANPATVADAAGFTSILTITASDTKDETNTYTIQVADVDGGTASIDVEISTSPLTFMTMVLLKNQGGPAGTGAVDLHTGESKGTTATASAGADLRDQGIDLGAPSNAENWIQKVAPINGSDLRIPADGFSFEEIVDAAQIQTAFDAATTVSESDKVITGDSFLILSEGTYFAVKVTDIVVTANDNTDRYVLSVLQ